MILLFSAKLRQASMKAISGTFAKHLIADLVAERYSDYICMHNWSRPDMIVNTYYTLVDVFESYWSFCLLVM